MPSSELQDAIAFERRLQAALAEAGPDGLDAVRATNTRFMHERAGTLPKDLVIETVDADGVPGEWVYRRNATGPTILFVHSGGGVVGLAAENREWMGRLTRPLRGRALGIDYRLAPEHAWPAQVHDTVTAYRWLLTQGHSGQSLVLMGESGGGAIALAAALALRDTGDPLPAALVLVSPITDLALTGETLETNADRDPFVTRAGVAEMMQALLQGQDPEAVSPLHANLSGLSPMLIQVGTAELMLDDGRRLAQRAQAAENVVVFEPWEDMIHLWHGFPELPEARQATDRIASFIAEHVDERD